MAPSKLILACVFFLFLSVAICLQWLGGAYEADIAGYDETAHYVSGLMVRTYVASVPWGPPMAFARAYYESYPRVAIGHWPPVFYVVQTIWSLPFSASRISILLLIAMLSACCALLMFVGWRRELGAPVATCAGMVFLLLPTTQQLTAMVMAEMLLVVWFLAATLSFAAFLKTERARESLLFGVFSVLAIMTKANGWALALLPGFTILLARRLDLLRRWQFWISAPLVAVFTGPWYLFTFGLAREGWTGSTNVQYLGGVVAVTNTRSLVNAVGIAIFLFFLAGVYSTIVEPWWKRQSVSPVWASAVALLLAVWMFHTWVAPVREPRHMVFALPAILVLAAAGVLRVVQSLATVGVPRPAAALGCALISLGGFGVQTFSIPIKPQYGAIELARMVDLSPEYRGLLLVSSPDALGEGAVIAEMAMRSPVPNRRVQRASKLLSEADWDGQKRRVLFKDSESLIRVLTKRGVKLIVYDVHASRSGLISPQYKLLGEIMKAHPDRFRQVYPKAGDNAIGFELYEVERLSEPST